MSIKDGVKIGGMKPELLFGIMLAMNLWERFDCPFTITSIMDGTHMRDSLHYAGYAFDCRLPSRYILDEHMDANLATLLKHTLGPQWDVILEKDHIHVEFDPKEKTNG